MLFVPGIAVFFLWIFGLSISFGAFTFSFNIFLATVLAAAFGTLAAAPIIGIAPKADKPVSPAFNAASPYLPSWNASLVSSPNF